MNQVPMNTQYIPQTPLNYYNNGSAVATNNGQQGTVSVSTPNGTSQVYQYPTTSIYDPNQKQAASGVNIYIYNPSAIGGPSSNSVANATYAMPNQNTQQTQPVSATTVVPEQPAPIANTPISEVKTEKEEETSKKEEKKKTVVELTDEYIKTLENYLRSKDPKVRKSGIIDLIKRFEEDSSRYDDPALTALLNISLQDPKPENRMLAMSLIAGENAHGDDNTIKFLKALQNSDKLFGQEARMATDAQLKAAQSKTEIPA